MTPAESSLLTTSHTAFQEEQCGKAAPSKVESGQGWEQGTMRTGGVLYPMDQHLEDQREPICVIAQGG